MKLMKAGEEAEAKLLWRSREWQGHLCCWRALHKRSRSVRWWVLRFHRMSRRP